MKLKTNLPGKSVAILKVVLISIALLASQHSIAQIPNLIPYQGQITDTGGKGFDGNFDFSFKILDNNNATLWSSGTVKLDVFQGSYSVVLGKSPQPSLPNGLVSNDLMFLEISFDDGTNGMETLSPNVQILPVPYAMRASMADSAGSASGQLSVGDSLVLRDASGDVRFVINPNTGVFKAVQNDTAWYSLSVNSPPKIEQGNGDVSSTEEQVEMNGKRYTKHTIWLAGLRIETWVQHDRDLGNQDTMQVTLVYDGDCVRERIVKYYKVSSGRTREVTYTYDCPSGKVKGIRDRSVDGDDEEGTTEENKETHTKTTKKTEEGRLQAATVDTRTGNLVAATFSPKDSCFIINADKLILKNDDSEYTIRLNKNGQISTESRNLGSNPPPPVMELVDPLQQFILEQGMKQVTYEYISPELVKVYRQAGIPEEIIERMNADAGEQVTQGIKTLQRLVDSVMVYKVNSQVVKDSIETIYNAVAHVIEVLNVAKYRQLSGDIAFIRLLNPNLVVEEYKNENTGIGIQRQTDLNNKKDVLNGADGSDVIMGGTTFTETYKPKTGTNSITHKYNPDSNWRITNGVHQDIWQIFKNDTFTQFYDDVDANGNPLNRMFVQVVPKDSLFIYDGNKNVVRRVGSSGFTDTYEYDQNSSKITERNDPEDSSRTLSGATRMIYDGVHTVRRETGTGDVDEVFIYDANNNQVRETTSPRDSSKVYVGFTTFQFDSPDEVVFEYDGTSNSIFTAHNPDGRSVITGGIKSAEWDFDTLVGGLYTDRNQGALNFTNLLTNSAIGLGFNPDNGTAGLISQGKTTLVLDTLMAFEQVRGASLEIAGNAVFGSNVNVIGNLSKGGGTFKIDHPLDPYNKYLYHSFIESPDMMNVYNGNTVTDSLGIDTIYMPEYFGALNKDFRYQLTCIGTFAQAIVLQEIEGNKFVIQTNKPKVKVSWQVTGIRKDTFANDNRVRVEVEKSADEKGSLLYPPKVNN